MKKFDFWNDHSLEFLEMSMKRDFQERIENPDGYGKKKRDCGDTIEFFIIVKDDLLKTISYDIAGCINTHACANAIINFAENKTIEKALEIQNKDIIEYLKTLPEREHHCVDLALGAFNMAIKDLA